MSVLLFYMTDVPLWMARYDVLYVSRIWSLTWWVAKQRVFLDSALCALNVLNIFPNIVRHIVVSDPSYPCLY